MREVDLKLLRSNSVRKLDRALVRLTREGVTSVCERAEDRLIELTQHPDPEVRRQAVFLLGMRLRVPRAFQVLLDLASGGDSDPDVVSTAIRSIGAVGVEHADLRSRSLRALARIALDSSRSDDDRGLAYLAARWAAGLATALELAHSPEDISRLKPDVLWLQSLIRRQSRERQQRLSEPKDSRRRE